MDLLETTDASVWAATFMDYFGNNKEDIDEGLMISWFANAIEVGRTFGRQPLRAKIQEAISELGVPHEGYPAPIVNASNILSDALRIG